VIGLAWWLALLLMLVLLLGPDDWALARVDAISDSWSFLEDGKKLAGSNLRIRLVMMSWLRRLCCCCCWIGFGVDVAAGVDCTRDSMRGWCTLFV